MSQQIDHLIAERARLFRALHTATRSRLRSIGQRHSLPN
jgi:hypothetical protein